MKISNHTKTIVAILTALVILFSTYAMIPSLAFRSGTTGVSGADYVAFEGTAGNDHYDSMQYSYMINQWASSQSPPLYAAQSPANDYFSANKSLRVGLTEYGEMASTTNAGFSAGIAYGSDDKEWNLTESWSSSQIPPQLWIQGWTFYLNYTRQGVLRAVEAWSMYSNTSVIEGARSVYSWYSTYNPGDVGAVLTSGTLSPTGVEILYDSARLVIGRTGVVIHDTFYNEDVAEVFITINFFKDTKYAIVYKDVKILLQPKILDQIYDFAFSERYELDLAANMNPSNSAYVHYYHNSNSTVYQNPLTGASSYDTLQAYDVGKNYIFFAGYWPNVTEYTVYYPLLPNPAGNNPDLLPFNTAIADNPGPSGTPSSPKEPSTPWIIAQWRYNSITYPDLTSWLAKGPGTARQFRAVEVVGMTDYNSTDPRPAKDANDTGTGVNQIETEVSYTLNNVFNPTDLNSLKTTATNPTANPFMWTAVGQTAAPADNLGSSFLAGAYGANETTLGLLDKNDTGGSIPYGLDSFNSSNYYETFSNSVKGTGSDTTTYKRTGLMGFVPGTNEENETLTAFPPQPIAGGFDRNITDTWFPSIDPYTQMWLYPFSGGTSPMATYHPNGILSLGGPKANQLTRYFNDFGFAITREGTSYYALVNGGSVTGTAPTSDASLGTLDFFPVSTWNVMTPNFGYTANYAVISLVKDVNGTRGLSIYGWNGRDTYWAAAWASQYLLGNTTLSSAGLPGGTVALILQITYGGPNMEPSAFTVVKALGTITEFGTDAYYTAEGAFDQNHSLGWSGLVSPTALPIIGPVHIWWYQKLPTTSTAKVDFN